MPNDNLASWIITQLGGKKAGQNEYQCECVNCGKRKMYINASTGLAFCFHVDCHYRANVIKLYSDLHGVTKQDAKRQVTQLIKRSNFDSNGLSLPSRILTLTDDEIAPHSAIQALPWPCDNLPITHKWAKRGRKYLESRGFNFKLYPRYDLRYVLRAKNQDAKRYVNHLVFPSYDANSKLNYWTTRMCGTTQKWQRKSWTPKDMSKPAMFGHHALDSNLDAVFLVEGPFDMLALRHHAIALLGSFLNKERAQVIANHFNHVILALDADATKSRLQVAKMLLDAGADVSLLDFESDPAESWATWARVYGNDETQIERFITNCRRAARPVSKVTLAANVFLNVGGV